LNSLAINEQRQTLPSLFMRLWTHISYDRRLKLGSLFILMILASFAEVFSIGSVIPFLAALTSPEKLFVSPYVQLIISTFEITQPKQLVLIFTIFFCAAAVLSALMRFLLLFIGARLSNDLGSDLSASMYRRTLFQPYLVHISRNSSEVISGISDKATGIIGSAILPFLTLLSSIILLVGILGTLFLIDSIVALSSIGIFGSVYVFFAMISKKRIAIDSKKMCLAGPTVIKALQEGLGGIRDVLIDRTQEVYCSIYRAADIPLRRAIANMQVVSAAPRYGVEGLGIAIIAWISYLLVDEANGIANSIPVLGAIVLGAQRLLPILQQIYSSWAAIRGGQASLQEALNLLDQPLPDWAGESLIVPLPFKNSIKLEGLGFSYTEDGPEVLADIGLTIPKGSCIGIIGLTGSGKSTLTDIMMGLLTPTSGLIMVDGTPITPQNQSAWHMRLAHVPQAIFLTDASVEENIAFGIPKAEIDVQRVRECALKAQISETVESWPQKYHTKVGERGVRLSGGQRQRIGIARALYKNADVIVFDEATSALDEKTELAVMDAIYKLRSDLTIIIVAHRIKTLKNCTKIVDMANGRILRCSSYSELSENS
jgi:ABC-type multidrug transport system fused ATPase/permease subunit